MESKLDPSNTSLSEIRDTTSSSKISGLKFNGEPGFLPSSFKDTSEVKSIQEYVSQIDKQKGMDSLVIENEEFMENMSDGGGSLTGYFFNSKLLQIKEWIGLSYGIRQHNFYFNNNRLVYVREIEDDFYVDNSGTDQARFDQHFKGDYYFTNNKLIDMVTLGHNRFEIDTNDPEKEFLEIAVKYQKIILHKRR